MITAERALHLSRMASSRVVDNNDPDRDDIIQEGALRILRYAERKIDKPESYLAAVARNRARSAIQHRTWTGQDPSMGTPVDPLRKVHDSIDAMIEADVFQEKGYEEPGFGEVEDRVSMRDEVEAAILRLPTPAQRAVARGRLEGRFGHEVLDDRSRTAANRVWSKTKAQLAVELAHLREEAA